MKLSKLKQSSGLTTILLTLVIVSLISLALFSMTGIYVKQIKGSRSALQTIQAYQAADTGAEYALRLILKDGVDDLAPYCVSSPCSIPNSTSTCPATSVAGAGAWFQYESNSTTTVKIKGWCGNIYRATQVNL
ncbi:MAG TPA: hypothetical protein ENL06_01595 [Candidatus Portnoybacteria bacterium]|nr:hypothetical protein [Candidatus Portnoybacteria bacterium]